jgi:OOP family OmpA-OmpF porin
MKNVAKFLLPAAALALGALGCAAPVPVKVTVPEPVAAPPPPPAAPEAPALVGLPLDGAQLSGIPEIEFDTNQATLKKTPQNDVVLNLILKAGKTYTMITKLRVEGHTDSDGDAAANQALSERRAQAVVAWLVSHGIETGRLNPVGCGARDPVLPNTTAENKARNRRTEFDIEEVAGRPIAGATAACAPNPTRKH